MDDNLYVLFEEVDRQHANMFRIINMLSCMIRDGETDNLPIVIEELKHYVQYHFSTEEQLFKKYNYSDIEAHLAEHASFTEKIADFDFDLVIGNPDISINLLNYLKDWLQKHVLDSDKKATQAIEDSQK